MTTGFPTPTAPRRRTRTRTFIPLTLAAWLVLEVWLLGLVAQWAGGLAVFALLLAGTALGVVTIKKAGRRAFRNLNETFRKAQEGTLPEGPQASTGNGMLMLAGVLLVIPGLLSDVLGLVLLVPGVRKLVADRLGRSLEKRMTAAAQRPGGLGDAYTQARIHFPDGKVVPGEVLREDGAPARPADPDLPRLTS
ncbi:FxsA family membrane protein [Streptomyces sp. BI20]|uniref:FxsA family membrane protein n=1 Tax=Streptomyces sp. BI20 TaxID=3403460 RepID=UPI003C743915